MSNTPAAAPSLPFLVVGCVGGVAPTDVPRFATLAEAMACIADCRPNPDYDTHFVIELTGNDGAEVVHVHPCEPDEADPDVMKGLWLESEDHSLFIIPMEENGGRDEVIFPEDTEANCEIAVALCGLWVEYGNPHRIPAVRYVALGLTKVDECLKRWSAGDGYYHA